MSNLSDEDIERLASAIARKVAAQRPAPYVLPQPIWQVYPWQQPYYYGPYVTSSPNTGTLIN